MDRCQQWHLYCTMRLSGMSEVAEDDHLQGYRCLLRAEDIWLLTKRKQSFTNWFTKLLPDINYYVREEFDKPIREALYGPRKLLSHVRQDGSGLDISNAWLIDVSVHYIRKVSYKGSRSQVLKNRLRLAFDGLTYPAAIFTAT